MFNLVDLDHQREWAGAKLINRRVKVCSGCLDKPQDQLRLMRLQPDPRPVRDPRPLNNAVVMGGYALVQRYQQITSSDAGPDAGSDAFFEAVGPAFDLRVVTQTDDMTTGYVGSPLAYLYDDVNADAGLDTGIDPFAAVPVPIDPPET